jgi:3-methyladenine DNA glycosylase AlkC
VAEPLKNSFGPSIVEWIAVEVSAVDPGFDIGAFTANALDGFEHLELTPRARHVSDALAGVLDPDPATALDTIITTVRRSPADEELTGMEGFRYLPFVYFVADHGIEEFDLSMTAQYELTRRFTAEFSIRAFIERYPDATLDQLHRWALDPDVHVRRLVSEGTRPRLPWAPRLRGFQQDPTPVLELLELLKDDPEEYVRRSVANNLNDISKDHPALTVDIAREWWGDGDDRRRRLVRHGLRTLVKRGDPDALDVLGFAAGTPVRVGGSSITPLRPAIGDRVAIEIVVENPSTDPAAALVDVRIHFVKANGSTSSKVFKGAETHLGPGGESIVRVGVSVRQHSTRTHYAGRHEVEALINGVAHPLGSFELEQK